MIINDRRSFLRLLAVAGATAAAAVAPLACTGDGDDPGGTGGTAVTSTDPIDAPDGDGPGVVSVADAAASPDGTDVTVRGFLVADSGVVVLAEALAESYPPQPGGVSLEVEGLDLSGLELQEQGPVRWSDTAVTLAGTINEGRLTRATVQAR